MAFLPPSSFPTRFCFDRPLFRRIALFAVLAVVSAATRADDVYYFSTLAGLAETAAIIDGPPAQARFASPTGIAVMEDGTIYVADNANLSIRRITPAGVNTVRSVAPGDPLRTVPPLGMRLATDGAGMLYIGDWAITRFDGVDFAPLLKEPIGNVNAMCVGRDGSITVATTRSMYLLTYAGPNPPQWLPWITVVSPVSDGIGTVVKRISASAEITEPALGIVQISALATAPDGSLFVMDQATLTLMRVEDDGRRSFIAGGRGEAGAADGSGAEARFGGYPATTLGYGYGAPEGMAIDASGTIFICDTSNHTIRRVTPDRVVSTIGGSAQHPGADDGVSTAARFRSPEAIAIDRAGNLYIADTENRTIRKGTRILAPQFSVQPTGGTLAVGGTVTLRAALVQTAVPATYQWRKDGADVAGATQAQLTLSPASLADSGAYTVTATNAVGTVSSNPAVVRVAGPIRIDQGAAVTVNAGETLKLTTSWTGGSAAYQWLKDGSPISGATAATLTIDSARTSDAGSYAVTATSTVGSITSAPITVSIGGSRIVNVSIRTGITTAAPMVTVGFVVGGGSKPLLVRTVGPKLKEFGVGDAIADPKLALFKGDTQMAANDNWSSAANASDVAAAAKQVGAFALTTGAADAALLTTLNGSAYTVQATGVAGATGTALVEVYDVDPASGGRLVNVSSRAQVGTGDNVLMAGFAVSGTAKKTLLIRAVGPTLATFGVAGALSDPKIELIPAGGTTAIATNDNWAGDPALAAAFTSVGAFTFTNAQSKDAALVVTVSPGSYSAKVSGVNGTTGEALVEIYELP